MAFYRRVRRMERQWRRWERHYPARRTPAGMRLGDGYGTPWARLHLADTEMARRPKRRAAPARWTQAELDEIKEFARRQCADFQQYCD